MTTVRIEAPTLTRYPIGTFLLPLAGVLVVLVVLFGQAHQIDRLKLLDAHTRAYIVEARAWQERVSREMTAAVRENQALLKAIRDKDRGSTP